MINEDTTIKIKKKTREMLESFKVHPRQGYDELISDIIAANKSYYDSLMELTQDKLTEEEKDVFIEDYFQSLINKGLSTERANKFMKERGLI